jgi:hypothetical protein
LCDVLVNCSDDPTLTLPLTKIANGVKRPLVRLAVDGTGETDVGRVSCSDGGNGHSCAVCTHSVLDLFRHSQRTPCPGAARNAEHELAPTIAGGAIAAAIAAVGLLQLQRLVTGNDVNQVIDCEVILDLTNGQLLPLKRKRSANCLSRHQVWRLTRLPLATCETTFAGLFMLAEQRLRSRNVVLLPHAHPLCTEAICACGVRTFTVGTRFRTPPTCSDCGTRMEMFRLTALKQINRDVAIALGIDRTPLTEVGLPEQGAMLTAFDLDQTNSPWRFVLA